MRSDDAASGSKRLAHGSNLQPVRRRCAGVGMTVGTRVRIADPRSKHDGRTGRVARFTRANVIIDLDEPVAHRGMQIAQMAVPAPLLVPVVNGALAAHVARINAAIAGAAR
jgi:hypothetical protein